MNRADYLTQPRPGPFTRLYDHDAIRALGREGKTARQVAEEIGCSYDLAWRVLNDTTALYGDVGGRTDEDLMRVRLFWVKSVERAAEKVRQVDRELRRRARVQERREKKQ